MILVLDVVKYKNRGLIFLLLHVLMLCVISCGDCDTCRMPDFNKKSTLYPIEINMTGSINRSKLRSFTSTGKFDIGYENESDIFIAYQNEENIPCVLIFRNATNHSESFVAKGNAKITTARQEGVEPTKNDKAIIQLKVSADANYKINDNWEVKPIIGFNEDKEKGVFSPVNELKITNQKIRNLSIPITSAWIRLNESKINSGKFVDIDNISFAPDGVVFNISLQSEFSDPVEINRIMITPNSKIAHNPSYDITGNLTKGNSIWIDDRRDVYGERMYGKISNFTDTLSDILIWANIINAQSNDMESYFEFYPVCRDPFKNKDKKYKTKFVTPYSYLNWVANSEKVNSISSGKSYSVNMKVKSIECPMITEVYLDGEYSMVEIYNPTNREIDLSDYFLVKTKSNGSFSIVGTRELYTLDGYPYGRQGTLGLPLYVDSKHNNTTHNIYEPKTQGSDLVIFGDDENNILCNYNSVVSTSNKSVLKPGKTMVMCGPGYLNSDGSFKSDVYMRKTPNTYISKSKKEGNIQIFVALDDSGFSGRDKQNKDVNATLNLKNNEGLAIIKKIDSGDIMTINIDNNVDKYIVVDVFPYDNGRSRLQAPFYMCRYDGIVFPYNRSSELDDFDYGEGVKREGLNKQWYLDEIGGTEEIHSFGSRYRSW